MTQRDGCLINHLIDDNFTDIIVLKKKYFQHKCNHCGLQSFKLSSKTQHHLKTCQPFLNHKKNEHKKNLINANKSKQMLITSMICFFGDAQIL